MKAIVTFQGFTESLRNSTGTEDLYWNLIREFAGKRITTFQPQEWDTNLRTLVRLLSRRRIREVAVIGYSWGAGYTSIKFAKLTRDAGISIPIMLLCDPVYRPIWLPAWTGANPLAYRALLRDSVITVPDNVKQVRWVRQYFNFPSGHDLEAKNDMLTEIHKPTVLRCGHSAIDSHPDWIEMVATHLSTLTT